MVEPSAIDSILQLKVRTGERADVEGEKLPGLSAAFSSHKPSCALRLRTLGLKQVAKECSPFFSSLLVCAEYLSTVAPFIDNPKKLSAKAKTVEVRFCVV